MKLSLVTIVGILLVGWFMIQPQQTGSGQDRPDTPQVPIDKLLEKSAALNKLDRKKTEELAAALSEQAPVKTKVVYKVKRVPVVKEVLATDKKILLRVNGKEFYAPEETTLYKGYLVIDINIDSLTSDTRPDEIAPPVMDPADTAKQIITEAAEEHINFWQQVKRYFKRK